MFFACFAYSYTQVRDRGVRVRCRPYGPVPRRVPRLVPARFGGEPDGRDCLRAPVSRNMIMQEHAGAVCGSQPRRVPRQCCLFVSLTMI